MNRFSLRTRLVALAVLLVAFAVTAVGAATYVALHSYLYSQLDQQVSGPASDDPSRAICMPPNGGPQAADRRALLGPRDVSGRVGIAQFACAGYRLATALGLPPTDGHGVDRRVDRTGPFTVHTTTATTGVAVRPRCRRRPGDCDADRRSRWYWPSRRADAKATLSRLHRPRAGHRRGRGRRDGRARHDRGAVGVAAAGSGDADGADRGGRAGAGRERAGEPGAGRGSAHRGRAAGRGGQHDARRGRERVHRPVRERAAAAPLPRRRLARAAHPAHVPARVRRAGPDARRPGPRGVRLAAPDRGRGHPDERPGRRPAHAGPVRPRHGRRAGAGRRGRGGRRRGRRACVPRIRSGRSR